MTELKKVVIVPRPGFREGIRFRFAGQQVAPMSADEHAQFLEGEFEPAPITEPVDIELEVPPLNFALIRRLTPQLEMLTASVNPDNFGTVIDLLAEALARNYRGIPRWLIEQTLDVANMPELVQAFMDVSGLKRKEQIDAKKATPAPSIGISSTAS